jgi:hypothetical protein
VRRLSSSANCTLTEDASVSRSFICFFSGVAISAQYAVSKLYNDPLLRTSISLIANQDGQKSSSADGAASKETDDSRLSVAVSSALLLAFVVGFLQLLVYSVLAPSIIKGMGVSEGNQMWHSAVSYLKVRALGTPAATLWLVTNGVFRGETARQC